MAWFAAPAVMPVQKSLTPTNHADRELFPRQEYFPNAGYAGCHDEAKKLEKINIAGDTERSEPLVVHTYLTGYVASKDEGSHGIKHDTEHLSEVVSLGHDFCMAACPTAYLALCLSARGILGCRHCTRNCALLKRASISCSSAKRQTRQTTRSCQAWSSTAAPPAAQPVARRQQQPAASRHQQP